MTPTRKQFSLEARNVQSKFLSVFLPRASRFNEMIDQNTRALRMSSALLAMLSLIAGFSWCGAHAQSLAITEFMAANGSGERDEDGDFSDWIEICNLDQKPASLLGWYLTEIPQNKTQWSFPALTVPAGGCVVVFA